MKWIAQAKADLAEVLKPYNALPYRGEKVSNTPLAWIENAEPFITEGDAFGEKRLNLQVTVFPRTGQNKEVQKSLDDTAVELIDLIEAETDFYVTQVNAGLFDDPGSGNTFAALTLNITTTN